MFYYLRRLNSHIASAETFNIPVYSNSEIECGIICSISNGHLMVQRDITKPKYLTLESKSVGESKSTISCVRLAPEMVLKCTPTDDITGYSIGDGCSLAANPDEVTVGISLGGSDAEVIDIDDKYVTVILR